MTNIILLGPPGSGKGTQSKLLVEQSGFHQISTGDLLRETVSSGSEEGESIKVLMEKGELVPDKMVIDMILKSMKVNSKKSIIFDGFPRNSVQAEALEVAFKKESMVINHVILLDVEIEILENRIKKRLSESKDDEKRSDDNVDTLLKRVAVYKEMTLPIIDYYEKKNKLIKINGMLSIKDVSEEISNILK